MPSYVDEDGNVWAGGTPAAVVRALRGAAWMSGPRSKVPYMREVAERCRELNPRCPVDPTSATAFVRTLVAAGFLKPAAHGRGQRGS